MGHWAWVAVITEGMAVAAWVATATTKQIRFTFLVGFNVMLPVALLHLMSNGLHWRAAAVLGTVMLYLVNMNVIILVWNQNTSMSKLDIHLDAASKHVLPLVMTSAAGWLYCLPFYYVAQRTGSPDWHDLGALVVFLVGFAIHLVADLQKKRFKSRPGTRGKILDEGLWRYSRHPNYFGDVVLYVGWALVAANPWAWLCPAANLLQYTFDAIPKNEKWAAAHYGKAWSDYVARTNRLVLGPRRAAEGTGTAGRT